MMQSLYCALAQGHAGKRLRTAQNGQAMAEGLAVLGLLLAVYLAIAWLGRYQDMALSAQHASRHAAFQQTRADAGVTPLDINRHFFSGPAHQWMDRRGRPVLGDKAGVGLSFSRLALDRQAEPGGRGGSAVALRRDWGMRDPGVLCAEVRVGGAAPLLDEGAGGYFELRFGEAYPAMHRHTAILTGAGHASGDTQTQQVLAQSELAWGNSAKASHAAGSRIAAIMRQVDAGWARTEPEFDWLTPWAGRIPDHHLVAKHGGRHD
ncbi:MAG: hypothetical protein WBA83_05325 [Burkholderiaceae bacterium]